jgi:hypothetical protein
MASARQQREDSAAFAAVVRDARYFGALTLLAKLARRADR